MAEFDNSVGRPRGVSVRQVDVARAVKGARQAGMDIMEVFVTKEGIRIRAASPVTSLSSNSWDEVLNDG